MPDLTETVLVSGAGGFIGRHVLAALAARGSPVAVLPREMAAAEDIAATVRDMRPRVIVHLAGARGGLDLAALYQANVGLALSILSAAGRLSPAPKVVLAGSAAEYGPAAASDLPVGEDYPCRPISPYGMTKLAQTLSGLAAAGMGVPTITARLFNVIGPGMPEHLALGRFAARIARLGPAGGVLRTGPLEISRDFILVTDVASALVGLAFDADADGLVVNVCSGRPVSLARLTRGLVDASGLPVRIVQAKSSTGPLEAPISYGRPDRLKALGLGLPARDEQDLVRGLGLGVR